jgi:predicted AAA+ superfamily ATPase
VDYLVGDRVAIEVKATRKASLRDARGLMALKEERVAKDYFLVSEDPLAARREGIEFLPWTMFLARLWEGDIG